MPTQKNSRIWNKVFPAITCIYVSLGLTVALSAAEGAVYTMTNAAAGNSVVMYSRSADGMISAPAEIPTGGAGTGGGLGSQGALALSDDSRWLFAVNAGSNVVTVFAVGSSGLTITDREPSGGTMPISVAVNKEMVVVLNAGGAANISAFRLTSHGALIPLPGSTRVLPGLAPAQVSFAAHGSLLVVTQKNFEYDRGLWSRRWRSLRAFQPPVCGPDTVRVRDQQNRHTHRERSRGRCAGRKHCIVLRGR